MSAKRLNVTDEGKQIEKTVDDNGSKSSKSNRSEWHNETVVPRRDIDCIIPIDLVYIIRECERKCGHNDEFGIMLKGKFIDDTLHIDKKYYIPQQEVTGASIDFLEDCPEWNGVLHKHPSSCKSFSGTDEKYINSNFEFSLLYVDQNITMGICNILIPNLKIRVRLPLRLLFSYPCMNVNENILKSKIKKKHVIVTQPNKMDYRNFRGLGLGMDSLKERPLTARPDSEDGDDIFNYEDEDGSDMTMARLLGLDL